jgi:hypothetical protein
MTKRDEVLRHVSGLLEEACCHTLAQSFCEREEMHCWVVLDPCGEQEGDPFYEWGDVLDFVADVTGVDPEEGMPRHELKESRALALV